MLFTHSMFKRVRETEKARGCLILSVLALCLVSFLGTVAQAQEFTFSRFEVIGTTRIDDQTVIGHTGIELGQTVSAADLNGVFQKLQETGFFSEVRLEAREPVLVIKLRERPTISKINFEGNVRLDDETLANLIMSKSRHIFSPAQADRDAEKIANTYAELGRIGTVVDPVIIPRRNNRVDLVFEISESRVIEIERIGFVGNRSFSDNQLRRVLSSKQAGFFRTVIRADVFNEERVLFDQRLLTDFYNARGFIDFRIIDSTAELTRERDAVFITHNVKEGQRFRFGNIRIRSEIKGIDTQAFFKLNAVKSGSYYSPALVDHSIGRMENLARRESLHFLRVETEIRRNNEDQTVDVVYVLSRGPRIFIERINVQGNVATLDRVIRRQFLAVEGDPLSPDEIRAAAERIRALGFFQTAEVTSVQGSAPDRIILNVDVEEKPTGSLNLAASYSSGSGVGFSAGFVERNLAGRGQTLGLNISTLSASRTLKVNFVEPAFLGRDVRLSNQLSLLLQKSETDSDYEMREEKWNGALGYPISLDTRLEVRMQFSKQSFSSSTTGSSNILIAEQGNYNRHGLGYSFSFNNQTYIDGYNRGSYFHFGQDIFGLSEPKPFLVTRADYGQKRNLFTNAAIWHLNAEFGTIMPQNAETIISDRFRFTSAQLRGFYNGTVGPRDSAAQNQDMIGGHNYFATRNELRFKIGLPSEYKISSGVFFDVASLWKVSEKISANVDDRMKLRSSAGISFFWTTPIGPLRFNFSRPVRHEPGDKPMNFEFTVQSVF